MVSIIGTVTIAAIVYGDMRRTVSRTEVDVRNSEKRLTQFETRIAKVEEAVLQLPVIQKDIKLILRSVRDYR
jgi:hypothetical protein